MVYIERICVRNFIVKYIFCLKVHKLCLRYKLKNGSKELTWVGVNEVAKDVCPNVLHFVDLLLSLPASSADCERGFSLTKFIKSDWRSKLLDKKVTNLMTVKLILGAK